VSAHPTLREVLAAPKTIIWPPKVKTKTHPSHRELDVPIGCALPTARLTAYLRVCGALAETFSCGLVLHWPGEEPMTVVRYNAAHGVHRNPDGTVINHEPHVHAPTDAELAAPLVRPELKLAMALSPNHNQLAVMWVRFCADTLIAPHGTFTKHVTRIAGNPSQFELFER